MSAEAFTTPLAADLRTDPSSHGVEVALGNTGSPRWNDPNPGRFPWAECCLPAEMAVRAAAETVATEPMHGLTGDHPERREHAAALLHATADLVRDLALDHAGDGALTDERWQARLAAIGALAAGGDYPPEGLSTRRDTVSVCKQVRQ